MQGNDKKTIISKGNDIMIRQSVYLLAASIKNGVTVILMVQTIGVTVILLQTIEVPLTNNQLDRLIKMLDKDGDGEVDYG